MRRLLPRMLVLFVLGVLIGRLLSAGVRAEPASTASMLEPCAGEIVSADGKPVPVASLIERIKADGGALVGERHGVRGHPQTLGCLARHLSATSHPTVVLEMLSADQQPALDAYHKLHPEIADGLGAELKWWTTGWPVWPVYAPLFADAWLTRTPLLAGDIGKEAPIASADTLKTAFGASAPAVQTSWALAMKVAHCNLIPDTKAAELARKQQTRDLEMTRVVASAERPGAPVLLYAGRAHIRKDRSVGYLLAHRAGAKPLPSIALFETEIAGKATDRAKVLAETKGQFDYVWFTGIAEKPDVCERLRAKGLIPTAGAVP